MILKQIMDVPMVIKSFTFCKIRIKIKVLQKNSNINSISHSLLLNYPQSFLHRNCILPKATNEQAVVVRQSRYGMILETFIFLKLQMNRQWYFFQSRFSMILETFISFKMGYNVIFYQKNIPKKSLSHFFVVDYT